jgi:hypothetical protein
MSEPIYTDDESVRRIAAEQMVIWKDALAIMAQGPCDGGCADPDCWTRREELDGVSDERL